MKTSNIILNIVLACILNSCSIKSESGPSQIDELTLNQFIEKHVRNWNWCYPDISDAEIKEMFEGDYYFIKKEGYLPKLRTNVYSVTTFCKEGGSFLVLESQEKKVRSIVPATAREDINMVGEASCTGILQVMDRLKNGDIIGVENYLNLLCPHSDSIKETELSLIFSSYLGRKYQTNRLQVERSQIKSIQELANYKYRGEEAINEFLKCLFAEETGKEKSFKKVLLFGGPSRMDIHVFIIKSSAEKAFINSYPYRVDYFIL